MSNTFGGRITFEFADTRIPPSEAEITIDPTQFEKEAKANQDGSGAYMLKPRLCSAEIKLRNHGNVDWQALLLKEANATIVEENTGRTHLFTKCQLTGAPKINLSTGEVDGLKIEGPNYRKV